MVVLLALVNAAHGYYDERNPTLVAYWPLNDGTNGQAVTVAIDVVAYPGHPATNGTSTGTGDIWFDDSERGIVYKTTAAEQLSAGTQGITNDFTWSLWVSAETNASLKGIMIGNRGSSGSFNKLTLAGIANWVTISPSGGWGVNDGMWHHMALRRDAGVVSVWIDGTIYPTTVTQSNDMNNPLFIGGDRPDWNESMDGMLSDVAIWNEALADDRIQGLAAGEPVIIGPPAGTVLIVK